MKEKQKSPKAKKDFRHKATTAGLTIAGIFSVSILGLAVYDRYSSYDMLYGNQGVMFSHSGITSEEIALPDNLKSKIHFRDDAEIEKDVDVILAEMNEGVATGIDAGVPGWINLHLLGGQNRKDAAAPIIKESHVYSEKIWDELVAGVSINHMCGAIAEDEKDIDNVFPTHLKIGMPYIHDIKVEDIRDYCETNRDESSEHYDKDAPEYVINEKSVAKFSKMLAAEQTKYKASDSRTYLEEAQQESAERMAQEVNKDI